MERKSQHSSLALNSGRTGVSLKEEEEEEEEEKEEEKEIKIAFKSKNALMFVDLRALRTHPSCFTFILMAKLALNYARSSRTHSSHKMRRDTALFRGNSHGVTS